MITNGLLNKQQLRQFVKEHNFKSAEEMQSTLKELFKDVLQEALQAELDTEFGYKLY